MKEGIHPKLVKATVICACGHTWETLSTREVLKTDLCSNCHPFYTGEQRIVDTAGQVERFMRRMNARSEQTARQVEIGKRTSKNKANVAPPPQERRPAPVAETDGDTQAEESNAGVATATAEPEATEE
jgi:large subunit ribosomal protein L31